MLIAILGYIRSFVPNNHCLIANGKIVASEKVYTKLNAMIACIYMTLIMIACFLK